VIAGIFSNSILPYTFQLLCLQIFDVCVSPLEFLWNKLIKNFLKDLDQKNKKALTELCASRKVQVKGNKTVIKLD
jgi:hypothetical protein